MTDTKHPTVFDAALPRIAYHGLQCPDEAHAAIAEAQRHGPIALGPFGPELISYDLVRLALRDTRFGMPAACGLSMFGTTSGPLWDKMSALIVGIDGADHKRLRRLVSRAFTPKAADRLRAACRDHITGLVQPHFTAGRVDVVADIARPYPVPIICTLLGVPPCDWPVFADWLRDIARAFAPTAADDAAKILNAWEQLDGYLVDLIERKHQAETEDLLSELIRAESDGDRLTGREILDLVAVLLVAGTDTTRNQLAAAIEVFCDHSEQWALLRDHPELAPDAVEEVMRYSPASFTCVRIAVEDVDVDGVVIPAGACVVVNTAAANRDPQRYEHPERFDITRTGRAAVMTFGGGAHHCLGAHLAKVELAEALVHMSTLMPRIRRAGPAPWRPIVGIAGPKSLPIQFDSAPLRPVG
ncbi:cytochrome P450 [Mycobacterium barrassiae]|uniref:cytochrome P450 n=1 Tax=Mycobacterium barrassiae TaxID=319709 RepID=UPI002265F20A|nr:cytochrome P450 [Mycobacterium barrassiae]MCV7299612.1 cytochrome P450 [Mycobacterium barrassiae]